MIDGETYHLLPHDGPIHCSFGACLLLLGRVFAGGALRGGDKGLASTLSSYPDTYRPERPFQDGRPLNVDVYGGRQPSRMLTSASVLIWVQSS